MAQTAARTRLGAWCSTWLAAACIGMAAATASPGAAARGFWDFSRPAEVSVQALPAEGQQTYALILQGGPFPFEKDGAVFGNRERLLPRERRGYYREYTVQTPRQRGRGARRIICGGPQPTLPEGCWYTEDHYASFRKIVP